jgi:hypothetical protein
LVLERPAKIGTVVARLPRSIALARRRDVIAAPFARFGFFSGARSVSARVLGCVLGFLSAGICVLGITSQFHDWSHLHGLCIARFV